MSESNPAARTVRGIMARVFRLKEDEINENTSTENVDAWDSLGHLNLISSLEDELRIRFTTDEIIGMKSYQSILQVINSKIK